MSVCLSVCLSVREHLKNHTYKLRQVSCALAHIFSGANVCGPVTYGIPTINNSKAAGDNRR